MLRKAALVVGVVLEIAWVQPGFAQATPPSEPSAVASQGETPAALGEVVVTATRISRAGFNAPTPTTVVTAADMENVAATNVAQFLNQEIPALAPTSTPATSGQSSQNAGSNFLDLRDLGPNRTLVLVDGARFVPSTSAGTVDTNLIPTALIDRVDVVTGGASAAWGSDAVAGVVNLVLKKNLQGLQVSAQAGQSQYGDNQDYLATLAYGTAFAAGAGHIELAGEFQRNGGVGRPDRRRWGQTQYGLIGNPDYARGNGQPQQLIVPNYQLTGMTTGGVILDGPQAGHQFATGGRLIPFVTGSPTDGFGMSGGNGTNTGLYQMLLVPLIRDNFFGRVSYDLTSHLNAYVDVSLGESQTLNPDLIPQFDFGSTIQPGNAYLSPDVAAQLGNRPFTLGRFSAETPIADDVRNLVQRYLAGLRGDFGNGWKWNAHAEWGRTRYSARLYNNLITANYALAEDAVRDPATNQIVCRSSLADPGNGCLPINLFGPGSPSAAALRYVTGTQSLLSFISETAVAADLQGAPFSTWAGPVSIAAGAEYRRESVSANSDPLSQSSAFLIGNPQPIAGAFNVKEGFFETVVPLAADAPFVKALDLNGAVRVTDYSTSGRVTTWKVGLSYSLSDELRFRATRSRDIRAPNLQELYTTAALLFSTVVNPANGQSFTVRELTVGNRNLKPEEADTTTLGVVYQPSWLSGLRTSLDVYDIRINKVIAQLADQDLVNRCFAGNTALCSFIQRDAAGNPSQLELGFVNLSQLKTRGADVELSYTTPLSRWMSAGAGDLTVRALTTYVQELIIDDGQTPHDIAGLVGFSSSFNVIPHWRGNLSETYSTGPWTYYLEQRFIGPGRYTDNFTVNRNDVGSVFYLNGSLRYSFGVGPAKIQIYGAVNNILNRDPPIVPGNFFAPGQTNPIFYDIVGRNFSLGVRAQF
jgi:outer membrane receptor protein involved in Fe transport